MRLKKSDSRKAAQYLRMSTDHQDLSPEIQKSSIKLYAEAQGLEVVETYFDAGKSGLTLQKRPAMKRLLHDVTAADCPYATVLVYDISRWGRFQDTDASAYYEYHCRLHGVDVRYVQEPFSTPDSPLATVVKSLKRAMAAEFSRELAVKTRAGQSAAIKKGYQVGTLPCLGFSRMAVSRVDGTERLLGAAEHKGAHREHVRWVLGPQAEVDAVRRIFDLYAYTELSVVGLAKTLQVQGITAQNGRPITKWMLYAFLRSEVVIGNFLWGRRENGRMVSPEHQRIRRIHGFVEPTVTRATFDAVQVKLARARYTGLTRVFLLERLSLALARNPGLLAIDLKAHGCPCRETYIKEFGSVHAAWAAAGGTYIPRNQNNVGMVASAKAGAKMCSLIATALTDAGVLCKRHTRADRQGQMLLLNGDCSLRVQVIRRKERDGVRLWALKKIYKGLDFDWVLVVRVEDDDTPHDSLLLSREEYFGTGKWLRDDVHGEWRIHRTTESIRELMASLRPRAKEWTTVLQ